MREEINMVLDEICSEARTCEMKNALHACRPGHPLNKNAAWPFKNALFVAATNRGISAWSLTWLKEMAAKENKNV